MNQDQWGPARFLIILPDKVSPNYPDGIDYTALTFYWPAVGFTSSINNTEFAIPYYGN